MDGRSNGGRRRAERGPPRAIVTSFEALTTAARAGATEVAERPGDPYRSFRESTLEAAIARHLPGRTETAQQRRRYTLPGFAPYPYGVDIEWRHGGTHAGIEV